MKFIAAVDKNWAIGNKGRLLIRISEDQRNFRQTTMGHVVVLGRKTMEEFPGGRPLKGRANIILKKIYTTRFGGNQVQALKNINFSVEEGEYVAIMGESGSGKTTLLNILAALDKPTAGEVLLNGKNLVSLKEKEISAFRREHLGFVFQDFNLLDNFSLKDNIFLPLVLSGVAL